MKAPHVEEETSKKSVCAQEGSKPWGKEGQTNTTPRKKIKPVSEFERSTRKGRTHRKKKGGAKREIIATTHDSGKKKKKIRAKSTVILQRKL